MKISVHLSVLTPPSFNLLTTKTMETKLESFFYHGLNRSYVGVFPFSLIPILRNMHAMNGRRQGSLLPLHGTAYNPSEFEKIQMLTGIQDTG